MVENAAGSVVISREAARDSGLHKFFTGDTCKHGHVAERYVLSGSCTLCVLDAGRAYDKRNHEARRSRLNEARKRWRAKNPGVARAHRRKSYHKHSIKSRARRLGVVGDIPPPPTVCDLCGGPPAAGRRLSLDHCHETNLFRGWLCHLCNAGLGLFGDTSAGVAKALAYIQRAEAKLASGK